MRGLSVSRAVWAAVAGLSSPLALSVFRVESGSPSARLGMAAMSLCCKVSSFGNWRAPIHRRTARVSGCWGVLCSPVSPPTFVPQKVSTMLPCALPIVTAVRELAGGSRGLQLELLGALICHTSPCPAGTFCPPRPAVADLPSCRAARRPG